MGQIADLKQKAKLPARQAGGGVVQEFFQQNRQAIEAVLPRHVNPDRMQRIALGALRTTPKLMECTTESLFGAVVVCAQLGLEPNTPLGHAYLIPFTNRKEGRTDVQVIFGYKGLIDLARRSGQIISIAAHAVHENDEFDYAYGLNERLEHKPASGDRGQVTHFYAVAKLKDGGHAFEVMQKGEVDVIRQQSQSQGKFGPWKDHYTEMGRKTVIRRLFKYLPVSIEVGQAMAIDDSAGTPDQDMSAVIDTEGYVVERGGVEDAPSADQLILIAVDADSAESLDEVEDLARSLPAAEKKRVVAEVEKKRVELGA